VQKSGMPTNLPLKSEVQYELKPSRLYDSTWGSVDWLESGKAAKAGAWYT